MWKLKDQVYRIESRLLNWAEINSHDLLRIIMGLIYILYGGLKFFPSYSPAEHLAVDTIEKLTFGLFSGFAAQITLAIMESALGLCLLFRFRLRWTIYAATGHIIGTFLPVFFFPELIFTTAPFSLSLVGQYILKNFIFLAAFLSLYAKTIKKQNKVLWIQSKEEKGLVEFVPQKQKVQDSFSSRKINSR